MSLRHSLGRRQFSNSRYSRIEQNLTEKIVQKYCVGASNRVFSGDYVAIKPHKCMSHDNTWPIALKFNSIGLSKVYSKHQLVFALDHDVQNTSESNLHKYNNIEKFARDQGIDFYPAGRGIGHQIMIEEGYALPMTFTVASDSHSNMYGGIGCLGTPIVRTDAASIWATGQTWWQIPKVANVKLTGLLNNGVTGKDVIIALCGLFKNDEVLNHAIEFTGEAIKYLAIDDRLAIANMTTEWGALSGLFPVDENTLEWYKDLGQKYQFNHPRLNKNLITDIELEVANPINYDTVKYAKTLHLDLSTLVPHVSGPNSVKKATPVHILEDQKIKINKAYLISCTNSRLSDLESAAKVLKGKKINEHVELYVAAASLNVQKEAENLGIWNDLVSAGAKILPSGCGPCIGLGIGLLKENEVGISSSNRNFKGRMGSREAFAYLASPAVVAASALKGYICQPGPNADSNLQPEYTLSSNVENEIQPMTKTEILAGFRSIIKGELVFCDIDNMNTDGIYPGKYTYQDDVNIEMMRSICMENYDKNFSNVVQDDDILISGYNFGCGSSREQAATALLAKKIPLVLAGSFSDIFKRNSINNALLCLEAPELLAELRKLSIGKEPTVRTGWQVDWNIEFNLLTVKKSNNETIKIQTGSLGILVQEIYMAGGIENWIKQKQTRKHQVDLE